LGIKRIDKICRKNEICIQTLASYFMISQAKSYSQLGFYSTLRTKHPLYILANQINWNIFEEAFAKLYSGEGRPAKPIRLINYLLIFIRTLLCYLKSIGAKQI
jgi:hypothetical protein